MGLVVGAWTGLEIEVNTYRSKEKCFVLVVVQKIIYKLFLYY